MVDAAVKFLLGGFRRWDAIYFLHIAEFGYTYENTLAFFPLFPMTVRLLANTVFFPFQYVMNYASVLLISATVFNVICFIQAAKYLYELTVKLIGDDQVALKVVQLFCLNPASIFFSAPYSEVMFAMFSFGGMLKVENNSLLSGALYFALSGATRSNGLINVAFIWHKQLRNAIQKVAPSGGPKNQLKWLEIMIYLVKSFARIILYTAMVVTPFVTYQYYVSTVFCNPLASYRDLPVHVVNYGNRMLHKMPHTGISAWCRDIFPTSYSYVQTVHWDVGFLNYYQWKQIPNFLLSVPVVVVGIVGAVVLAVNNPWGCVSLGLFRPGPVEGPKVRAKREYGFDSDGNLVYMVHMMALLIFGVLYMHVQVLTRFICCSCPVFYFILTRATINDDEPITGPDLDRSNTPRLSVNKNGSLRHRGPAEEGNPGDNQNVDDNTDEMTMHAFMEWDSSFLNKVLYVYLHLYFFVGIAAFSNFLPWT